MVKERVGMVERVFEGIDIDGPLLFLSGADMDPTAVLATYPGARFVARARLGEAGDEEVWGILVQAPDRHGQFAAEEREVVTDDLRVVRAVPVTKPEALGDPAAIIAAAKYWELPPAYVERLRDRVEGERG